MPGSLRHLLSALGSPPGMADAMLLKPNWSIFQQILKNKFMSRPFQPCTASEAPWAASPGTPSGTEPGAIPRCRLRRAPCGRRRRPGACGTIPRGTGRWSGSGTWPCRRLERRMLRMTWWSRIYPGWNRLPCRSAARCPPGK